MYIDLDGRNRNKTTKEKTTMNNKYGIQLTGNRKRIDTNAVVVAGIFKGERGWLVHESSARIGDVYSSLADYREYWQPEDMTKSATVLFDSTASNVDPLFQNL